MSLKRYGVALRKSKYLVAFLHRDNIALSSFVCLKTKIISKFQLQRYQLRIILGYCRNFFHTKNFIWQLILERINRKHAIPGLRRMSKTHIREMIFLGYTYCSSFHNLDNSHTSLNHAHVRKIHIYFSRAPAFLEQRPRLRVSPVALLDSRHSIHSSRICNA